MRCPLCGEGVFVPLQDSPVAALGRHFERRCTAIPTPPPVGSRERVKAHLAGGAGQEGDDR